MNQLINLEDAQVLIARLNENPVTGLPVSETFDVEILSAIIGQEGFASLRIYFGQKEDGSICTILVGVDSDGKEMVEIIAEDGYRCPPVCPESSILKP